ncbi:MAG: APC family permease [Actinobacteria bacterium]|nr:APC family permease [Actinomycetota bacterium]
MSTTDATPAAEPGGAGPAGKAASFYTRKATGLVREGSLLEMMVVNGAAIQGISLGLAVGFFFAAVAFPGANLVLALLITIGLSLFVWVSFALLAVAMPRAGGDYLYASRILHPIVGMASNVTLYFGTIITLGAASAYYLANIGLGSAFDTIGSVTGNEWWINAAATVNQPSWSMWIALGVGAVLTILSIWGTKHALKVIFIGYLIAIAGLLVATLAMLFTSHDSFINSINSFAGHGTYEKTVSAGLKEGLYGSGYSTRNTIGAIFTMESVVTAAFFSVYLNGEMKGAGQRKRQLWSIVGGGLFQGLALLVCGVIFLSTAGAHFFTAATGGLFPVENGSYFSLFSALASGSTVIAVFIALAFLGVFPAFLYGNMQMAQRAPFVWALDGVAPKALAKVSDRTHTPELSIVVAFVLFAVGVIWYRINPNILTIFTYAILFTAVPMLICAVCGVLLPFRRPDLYRGTPADWKVFGMPVIVLTSICAAAFEAFVLVVIIPFHENIGIGHPWIAYVTVGVALGIGAAWYLVAKAVQARRGVDLDLAYKTIPAE